MREEAAHLRVVLCDNDLGRIRDLIGGIAGLGSPALPAGYRTLEVDVPIGLGALRPVADCREIELCFERPERATQRNAAACLGLEDCFLKRSIFFAVRQHHVKTSASIEAFALGPYTASVQLYQLLHKRESNSGAFVFAR